MKYLSTLGSLNKEIALQFTLEEILEDIRDGFYKDLIERMNSIKDPDRRASFKRWELPAMYAGMLFQAEIPEGRYTNCLSTNFRSAGLSTFDFDDVEDMAGLFEVYSNWGPCVGAFRSPGRKGLKVIVAHQHCEDLHMYKRVKKGIELPDRRWLDVSSVNNALQKCFVSWDPDAHINIEAQPLDVVPADLPVYRHVAIEITGEEMMELVKWADLKVLGYDDYFKIGTALARYGCIEAWHYVLRRNDWSAYDGRTKKYCHESAERDFANYVEYTRGRLSGGQPCTSVKTLIRLADKELNVHALKLLGRRF